MMKKHLLICILFLVMNSLYAQDSLKKIKIGLDVSFGSNALGKSNLYPVISLSTKKHVVFAGPALIYLQPYNRTYTPTVGLCAGYQFYPWAHSQRFNLFFEYDFSYLHCAFKKNSYYTTPYGPPLPEKQKVDIFAIDSYIGAGCRFNVFNWLYLKLNAGIGAIYYDENYRVSYNNGPTEHPEGVSQKIFVGSFHPFNTAFIFNDGYDNLKHEHIIATVKLGAGIAF